MRPDIVTVTPVPILDWSLTVPAALTRAGYRVAATGWLGPDDVTEFAPVFETGGIADQFVRLHGGTRAESTETAPAERGALMERILALAATAPAGAPSWFILAGPLPRDVDPGFYCEVATLVGALGARVMLDASGEPLRRALKAEPHVIRLDARELEALAGAPTPKRDAVIAAARGLLRGETELVVVSTESSETLFVEDDRVVMASVPPVSARSGCTVGNAMVAGIVAARLKRLELGELARLAGGLGIAAVTQTPAETWLPEVVVEKVPSE